MNKQQYIVGGAVRDALLQRIPNDTDFVWTGCTEDDFSEDRFSKVGNDFPVFLDQNGNEHALARTERKSGIGHNGFVCEFDPTVTLEQDLYRRDLTINAMAVKMQHWYEFFNYGLSGQLIEASKFLIDPYDGFTDLMLGKVQPVSDHFFEDPLRILRALRFCANFDEFHMSTDTMKSFESFPAEELRSLSKERITAEWLKVKNIPVMMKYVKDLKLHQKLWPEDNFSWLFSGCQVNQGKVRKSAIDSLSYVSYHLSESEVVDMSTALDLPSTYSRTLKAVQSVKPVVSKGKGRTEEDVIKAIKLIRNVAGSFDHIADQCKRIGLRPQLATLCLKTAFESNGVDQLKHQYPQEFENAAPEQIGNIKNRHIFNTFSDLYCD